jgi:hypothetical protein
VALKSVDVVVVAKLLTYTQKRPFLMEMAHELDLNTSVLHQSLKRLQLSRLIHSAALNNIPNRTAIREFFIHGVKYAFPAERGEMTRGLPTSYAGPPLADLIVSGGEPPPVWPFAEGTVRGISFQPFYKNVPTAALKDLVLYRLLALLDALRDGRSRERKLAEQELKRLIGASAAES